MASPHRRHRYLTTHQLRALNGIVASVSPSGSCKAASSPAPDFNEAFSSLPSVLFSAESLTGLEVTILKAEGYLKSNADAGETQLSAYEEEEANARARLRKEVLRARYAHLQPGGSEPCRNLACWPRRHWRR